MEAKLNQNSICIELESSQEIRYIGQLNLSCIKTLTLEIINKSIGIDKITIFNAKQNEIELNEKQIGIQLELNEQY